jgi:putative MATE family efflux protein
MTIVRLAAPAIAGQVLQTGVIYADRVMLGHASSGALAAMQIAGPLEWTLVSVTSAFAVGTLALVGRAFGAGRPDEVRRHATVGLVVAALLGVVATLLAFCVLPLLPLVFPHASRGPDGAIALSRAYFRFALLAAPFYCIGAAGFAALSACRDTMTPLKIGVAVNIVHVAINWLLISGHAGFPAMGAAGAGLSTAVSFLLEATLTLAVLSRRGVIATIRPLTRENLWPFGNDVGRAALRRLYALSLPATTERLIYHAGYMIFVWMIALLGDDAMAANQALIAIEAISFMTVDGFAIACASLVAQELGAGRPRRAKRVGWQSTMLAVATLSFFGACFFLFRKQLPAIVTPRADLQHAAAQAIIVMSCAQPFMAIGVVLGQGLRGAGATRTSLLVSLVAGFGVRLLVTWIATSTMHLGIVGVWAGSTADWMTRTMLLVPIWRSGRWRAPVDEPIADVTTAGPEALPPA